MLINKLFNTGEKLEITIYKSINSTIRNFWYFCWLIVRLIHIRRDNVQNEKNELTNELTEFLNMLNDNQKKCIIEFIKSFIYVNNDNKLTSYHNR